MARVLAYTSPGRGDVYPLVPILLALRERGHEVHVRTMASGVAALSGLGLHAEPIDPRIEAMTHDDGEGSPRQRLRRGIAMFTRRAALDGPDLERAIEQVRPDTVLMDLNCWGAQIAAEAWGGRVAWGQYAPYPLPISSADTPPFGPGWAPARGPLGRLRDTVMRPVVLGGYARIVLPSLNQLRTERGLAPVRRTDDMFTRSPLMLALTAEPFEYPRRDWPASVVQVGPCHWDPPSEPPSWLDELEGPVVLVTTSSEPQNDSRLVECALEALADEPVQVVATVPNKDAVPARVPGNARVERFVPHAHLLPRTACVVAHAGMGVTQKALAAGVPVCAVPFGRDQYEVARRVEVAGAGTRLPSRRLSPARLRTAVREAMARTDGARAVAEGFAVAGGPEAAADAVEQRLLMTRTDPEVVSATTPRQAACACTGVAVSTVTGVPRQGPGGASDGGQQDHLDHAPEDVVAPGLPDDRHRHGRRASQAHGDVRHPDDPGWSQE